MPVGNIRREKLPLAEQKATKVSGIAGITAGVLGGALRVAGRGKFAKALEIGALTSLGTVAGARGIQAKSLIERGKTGDAIANFTLGSAGDVFLGNIIGHHPGRLAAKGSLKGLRGIRKFTAKFAEGRTKGFRESTRAARATEVSARIIKSSKVKRAAGMNQKVIFRRIRGRVVPIIVKRNTPKGLPHG